MPLGSIQKDVIFIWKRTKLIRAVCLEECDFWDGAALAGFAVAQRCRPHSSAAASHTCDCHSPNTPATSKLRRVPGRGVPPPRRNLGSSSIVAMAATALRSAQLGLLFVVAFLCVASAAGNGEIEAGAMGAGIPTRHLLQTVQGCPIVFATQNYTGVTSVCNATNPNLPVCCQAFIDFACPFASYINDPTTNCNVAMFTYLNMAGNYPEQLFQSCQGDANGLPCPLVPEPSPNPSSATMDVPWRLSSLVIFLVTLVPLVRYS